MSEKPEIDFPEGPAPTELVIEDIIVGIGRTGVVAIARGVGLEKVEAEFIGEQTAAIKMFALLGFSNLVRLPEYVKDMQAVRHDYVLMGLNLKTDEEYAGVG